MSEANRDMRSTLLGWLFFVVPIAVALIGLAWIASWKLGVPGGVAYVAAVFAVAALGVWRALHQ